jgi:hypothetical protein
MSILKALFITLTLEGDVPIHINAIYIESFTSKTESIFTKCRLIMVPTQHKRHVEVKESCKTVLEKINK